MAKGINNITIDDKAAVLKHFEQWTINRANPARADIHFLFRKYHEYVYKSPSDMSCSSCVQYIYDFWKKQTHAWLSIS